MNMLKICSVSLVAVLLGVLAVGPVTAATLFTANLSGMIAGTPSAATGFAELILNDAETEVAYTITLTNLEGVEGGAHFHNAPPGSSGGVLHTLALGSPKVGVWMVNPADVVELFAGRVYVNIHTDSYGAGEIRGDVAFNTVSAEQGNWSDVKQLYR